MSNEENGIVAIIRVPDEVARPCPHMKIVSILEKENPYCFKNSDIPLPCVLLIGTKHCPMGYKKTEFLRKYFFLSANNHSLHSLMEDESSDSDENETQVE